MIFPNHVDRPELWSVGLFSLVTMSLTMVKRFPKVDRADQGLNSLVLDNVNVSNYNSHRLNASATQPCTSVNVGHANHRYADPQVSQEGADRPEALRTDQTEALQNGADNTVRDRASHDHDSNTHGSNTYDSNARGSNGSNHRDDLERHNNYDEYGNGTDRHSRPDNHTRADDSDATDAKYVDAPDVVSNDLSNLSNQTSTTVTGDRPPSSASNPPVLPQLTESIFAQIFQRSPDAMTLSTLAEGYFIAANDSFLQLSGYERDELIGQRSTDLNFWPNPEDRDVQRRKILQQKSLYNEEGGFWTKSGEQKIVRVSAEIIPIEGIACVLCSIRDVTQEKEAELQLKLADERDRLLGKIALNIRQSLDLKEILHSTVDEIRKVLGVERVFIAHFDQDKNGSVVAESVLPPFPSLKGEVVGKDVYDELLEIYSESPIRVVNDMEEIKESICYRLLVERYHVKAGLGVSITIDGELFGVLVAHQCTDPRPWTEFEQQLLDRLATQVAIAINQGELYSQIQCFNANLEQQVADRTLELQQQAQKLEQLGKFRDFLLYAVTHDLRTSVVGTTMLLQSLASQNGETINLSRRLLDEMIRASNVQRDKLDAIQEVHALTLQGLSLRKATVIPELIVNDVVSHLQPRAEQSNTTIVNQLPPDLPSICGDPMQIKRVFQHLITNAIAHNPPGVIVTICADIQSNETGDVIRFQVTDNGQGIEPEKRDRLFQLCSDRPEARRLGGICLGLYLCRQIIDAHGGTIGVESMQTKGTTVWFTLPISAS